MSAPNQNAVSAHTPAQLEQIQKVKEQIMVLQKRLQELEQSPRIKALNVSLKICFSKVFDSARNFMKAYKKSETIDKEVVRIIHLLTKYTSKDVYNDIVYRIVSIEYKSRHPRDTHIYSSKEIKDYISKTTMITSIDTLVRILNQSQIRSPALVDHRTALIQSLNGLKTCVSGINW